MTKQADKGRLRVAIEDFFETYIMEKVILKSAIDIAESFEFEIADHFRQEIIDEIMKTDIPPFAKKMLHKALDGTAQGGAAALLGFGTSVGSGAAASFMAPIFRLLNYSLDKKLRTNRIDLGTSVQIMLQFEEEEEYLKDRLAELGWSDYDIDLLKDFFRPRYNANELFRLYWLNEIDRDTLIGRLNVMGYDLSKVGQLEELLKPRPQIGDVISFAVREVYNESQAQELGLYQDIPQRFIDESLKLGLTEEYASQYWAAHWQLPGINQVFEMLHRLRNPSDPNHVSIQTVNSYLKAADISPAWRDRLIELSYQPYTRVDVRRMYKEGVIDAKEVLSSYMDIGYNTEKAEKLAQWTIKQTEGTSKDLTRSAIQDLYIIGEFTRNEALESLQSIGYDELESESWLDLADYELTKDNQRFVIDRVDLLYLEGEIDDTQVLEQLGQAGFSSEHSIHILNELRVKKRNRIALPSKSELEKFYKEGIITLDNVTKQLKQKGYSDERTTWLTALIDIEVGRDIRNETEKTRKELERLKTSELREDYQVEKAAIDVIISDLKADIADLKLALYIVTNDEDVKNIKRTITEIKRDIAILQVQKAEIRHDLNINIDEIRTNTSG